jgi:hypothetical protein
MDKSLTEAQNRPVWQRYGSTRVSLIVMVLGSVMAVLTLYGEFVEQTVFACSDGDKNPPDVIKQCKQLTKYQWWGHYYQGKKP